MMEPGTKDRGLARWVAFIAVGVLGAVVLYAPWSSRDTAAGGGRRTIVAYGAVSLEEVFTHGVFPAFEEDWRQRTGEEIHFAGAFNPLGTITDALLRGAPADLALLSAASGAQDLELAGIAAGASTLSLPHGGVLSRTPIIICVRSGNPLGLRSFEDLAKPGVKIVQPDPLVSGIGQWVIFAEYGSALRRTGDAHAASELLFHIARNMTARAASPLEARNLFENGIGDALVTSEHEAHRASAAGSVNLDVIYPRSTILSEPTLVLIGRNIDAEERPVIDAFLAFLWSKSGQDIFVRFGFRSVDERLNASNPRTGRLMDPFRIEDLGGWKSARRQIIDGVWRNRVLKEVER